MGAGGDGGEGVFPVEVQGAERSAKDGVEVRREAETQDVWLPA